MAEFFDLVAQLQEAVDDLDAILSGSGTVDVGGVQKDSITKAIADRFAALQAQVQGSIAYETKAAMDSAGAPPAGELAKVWNDPTEGNNGLYGYTGGAWVKSQYDPEAYAEALLDAHKQTWSRQPTGRGAAIPFAVRDSQYNLPLYVDAEGNLHAHRLGNVPDKIAEIEAGNRFALVSNRAAALAVVDSNYNCPLYITHAGEVVVNGSMGGSGADPRVDSLQLAVGGQAKTVTCWGDSLTKQPVDNAYPEKLQAKLGEGWFVNNQGISGHTSSSIALRQGGLRIFGSIAGNQIPASGSVSVSVPDLREGAEYFFNTNRASIGVTVHGVAGTLKYDGPDAGSSDLWVFTRDGSGAAVDVPPRVQFVPTSAEPYRSDISIFLLGRNNLNEPEICRQDVERCIAQLSPADPKFIILSVTNASVNPDMAAMYDALWAKYPDNFIDLNRELLLYPDDQNPQDAIDIANGVTPLDSQTSDGTHYNDNGADIVATIVHNFMQEKGWV